MNGPKFVLHGLGGLSMKRVDAHASVLVGQRKRLGLLAILAVAGPSGIARERVLALLWPESDDAHARNAFNQLVYMVRRDLGVDAILEADGVLSLGPEVVGSDVAAFTAALARGEFADAVALYSGPFLDGVYLKDAPDFERWVEQTRLSLANVYAGALDRLVASALASGDTTVAVRWARSLVDHDPLSTAYVLRLVRALDEHGDYLSAIRHADVHVRLLKQELGLDPPAELVDVTKQLRGPRAQQIDVASEPLVKPTAAEQARVKTPPRRPPQTRRRVQALAAGVTTAGAVVFWSALVNGQRHTQPIRVGALGQIIVVQSGASEPAISPDGNWLAFAANKPGDHAARPRSHIYVRQIAGSRVIDLTAGTSSENQHSPAWSPDGTRIAFKVSSGMFGSATPSAIQVVPALGGTPETLISDTVGNRFLEVGAWAHDGNRLVFSDTAGLWIYDSRAGRSSLLVRTRYHAQSGTWSPDDSLIAYVVGTGSIRNIAPNAIWITRASGGAPVQVTEAVRFSASPAFTPDGKNLLYISDRDGARDIYQQPIRHGAMIGKPVRLTTGANVANISLAADGRSLVYGSYHMRSNIWSAPIAPLDETPISAARQITFGDQEVECISVSRDGEWLVYDSNLSGNQDIYKLRIAGGDPVQLTTDPADDFCPTMSPTGQEIGFYSLRRGGVRRVFTMLSNGARQRPVLPDSSGEQQFGPRWRADGNALAFSAAGAGVRHVDMVFRQANGEWTGLRHTLGIGGASWSPDGKWLVTGGDDGIAIATPDGHKRRILVPRSRLSVFFDAGWGLNSEVLFFRTEGKSGESLFWSVPTVGGEPRLLLRIGDALHLSRTAIFAADATHLYFTLSNDAAAIWRLSLAP